jgi:hypothetical protein
MADPTLDPTPGDDAGGTPNRGSTGMPRWVKVSLIIAIVMVVAFIVLSQLLGVQHGPRLH